MTREGQKRINVYLPGNLYSRVLNSEYKDITEAVINGLEKLLEPPQEDRRQADTNTQESSNSLHIELIKSLNNHIESLESQIMVKDEQLRTQAVHLQTVLTQKYIAPPEKSTQKAKSEYTKNKPEYTSEVKQEGKAQIEKICKNCLQPFLTENPKKETCSSKCRSAFNRKMRKESLE